MESETGNCKWMKAGEIELIFFVNGQKRPSASGLYASRRRTGMRAESVAQALSSSVSVSSVVDAFPSLFLLASHQQVGPNEGLQIAVEHPVDVPDLGLGAVILDHAVGLENRRAEKR